VTAAGTQPLAAALAQFDAAEPIRPEALLGRWRGEGIPTGHPMDGLMETYRWWGKAFRSTEDVDPLLFVGADGRVRALDPRRLSAGLGARRFVPRSVALGRLSAVAHPLLATRRPRARLRSTETRGVVSAAMVYDHLPIIDAFRVEPDGTVLGLMDRRGDPAPFCFALRRED
jgi:hypothetical protein